MRIHRHRRAIGNTELRTLGQLVVTRLGNLHALARLALTRLIRRIVLGVLLRLIQDGHHGIDRLRRTVRVGDQHIHRVRGIGIDLGSGAREGTVGTKGQVAQTGRLGIAEREVRAGRNGGIRDRSGNRVGVELNNRHRLVLRLVQILVVLLDDGDLDGHVLLGAIGIGDRHGSLDLGAGLDIAVDHDGDLARIRVDLHRRVLGNGERGALGQLVITGLRNLHGLARLARLVLIRRIMGLAVGLRVRIGLGILLRGIIHGLAGVGVDLGVQLLAVLDTVTIGIGILRIRVARLTVRIGLMVLERILRTMHLVTIVHAVLVGVRIQRISTVVLLLPILQAIAISVIVLRIGTVLLLVVILDAVVVIVVILDVRRAVTIGVQLELGIDAIGNRTGVLRVGHHDGDGDLLFVGAVLASRRDRHRDLTGLRIDSHRVALGCLVAILDGEHRARRILVALVGRLHLGGLAGRNHSGRILGLRIDGTHGHRHLGGVLGPVRIGDRHGLLDRVAVLGGVGNRHRNLARVRIHRHRRAIGNTELRTLGQLVVTRLGNLHRLTRLALTRLIRRIMGLSSGRHVLDRDLDGLLLGGAIRIGHLHGHRVIGILVHLRGGTGDGAGLLIDRETGQAAILGHPELRAFRHCGIGHRSGDPDRIALVHSHVLVCGIVDVPVLLVGHDEVRHGPGGGLVGERGHDGDIDLGARLGISGSDDSHHTGRLIDGDLVALWSSVGPRNAERFIRC